MRNPRRASDLLDAFARARLQGATLLARDADLLTRYLAQLRRRNLLDFDDLVALAVRLLAEHPEIARTVAARWDYLLVDESQDLDPAQYHLIRMLVAPHGNVFAVGDDEQSIFSWAGSDLRVLERFGSDHGISSPIVLDKNHRTTHQIFSVARRLVSGNPSLFEKELTAPRLSRFEVTAHGFPDDDAETEWILADLAADLAAHRAEHPKAPLSWGDCAVHTLRRDAGAAVSSDARQ